jgi:hypothetical protein
MCFASGEHEMPLSQRSSRIEGKEFVSFIVGFCRARGRLNPKRPRFSAPVTTALGQRQEKTYFTADAETMWFATLDKIRDKMLASIS